MIPDFGTVTRYLTERGVIVAGGWAASLHGLARNTVDVDYVYARTGENIARLVAAIRRLDPYLRDAPAGLPLSSTKRQCRWG